MTKRLQSCTESDPVLCQLYSTLGGTSGYTLRATTPVFFPDRELLNQHLLRDTDHRAAKVLRTGAPARLKRWKIIRIFHRPSRTLIASSKLRRGARFRGVVSSLHSHLWGVSHILVSSCIFHRIDTLFIRKANRPLRLDRVCVKRTSC